MLRAQGGAQAHNQPDHERHVERVGDALCGECASDEVLLQRVERKEDERVEGRHWCA